MVVEIVMMLLYDGGGDVGDPDDEFI